MHQAIDPAKPSDRLIYGGWVPLVELAKLAKLELLHVTLADIRSAIGADDQQRSELILSSDGLFVRRRYALPPSPPIIGAGGIKVCMSSILKDNYCNFHALCW